MPQAFSNLIGKGGLTMFEAFFNFTKTPFSRDIPSASLFVSPHFTDLQNRLAHGVKNRNFLIVTGDSGSGKSTAIRHFISTLDSCRTATFYVSESNLSPRNFYHDVLIQLGIKPRFYRGDAKRQFVTELHKISTEGRLPVVIIDEVHLCNMEMLTEIRFLLNFDMDSSSPMALILAGQSEVRDILRKQVYEAISQRIDLRCHLPPLDLPQTAQYISAHILFAAGTHCEIFNENAVSAIFDFSGGLPRKINRIATLSLMHAAQSNKRYIDEHMVSLLIDAELSW